jgi:hypothetical protein
MLAGAARDGGTAAAADGPIDPLGPEKEFLGINEPRAVHQETVHSRSSIRVGDGIIALAEESWHRPVMPECANAMEAAWRWHTVPLWTSVRCQHDVISVDGHERYTLPTSAVEERIMRPVNRILSGFAITLVLGSDADDDGGGV